MVIIYDDGDNGDYDGGDNDGGDNTTTKMKIMIVAMVIIY